MPAGLGGRRDLVVAAVLHALDLALEDAELDRVALVVGGIDRQHARLDLLQAGRRIVVARGVIRVDVIVGIGGEAFRQPRLHDLVGLRARRRGVVERPGAPAGGHAEEIRGEPEARRLLGVVAVVVGRIGTDRLDHHAAEHPVASRHGGRLRAQRHQHAHEVGIHLAPDPGVHAAHRLADHQLEMADAQVLGEQAILRHHHVVVIVFRKARAHSVRGPRRLAGPERIRNDDEIFGGIERLAGAEQLAREALAHHGLARAARAMQHQHRLARGRAQRPVVQPQFRQHLAGVKAESPSPRSRPAAGRPPARALRPA